MSPSCSRQSEKPLNTDSQLPAPTSTECSSDTEERTERFVRRFVGRYRPPLIGLPNRNSLFLSFSQIFLPGFRHVWIISSFRCFVRLFKFYSHSQFSAGFYSDLISQLIIFIFRTNIFFLSVLRLFNSDFYSQMFFSILSNGFVFGFFSIFLRKMFSK